LFKESIDEEGKGNPVLMDKRYAENSNQWREYAQKILTTWFFVGMPLSILLSGLYMVLGFALPPLLFFLPALTYLSGGLLGSVVSGESLRRSHQLNTQFFGSLLILAVSIAFLVMGIIFAAAGFRRL
jgi:hypothetical protein